MDVNPELIHQAILRQLKKVKRAGGYQNDVKAIYRIDLLEDQIPTEKLPALYLFEDPEGETFDPGDQYYRARLPFSVGGMVNVPTDDVTDPKRVVRINSLERDARTALLQDKTFGGVCKDSVLHRKRIAVDPDRGFAYFQIDMHATYHFDGGSL